MWAKVTSPPANGVSAGLPRLGVGNTLAIPPQPWLPVGASRAVLYPAVLRRGGDATEEEEYLHREKIKASRSLFHLHGFRLIIYPGPSAPGNFAPGHWARTRVRALPWDPGVELGPGAVRTYSLRRTEPGSQAPLGAQPSAGDRGRRTQASRAPTPKWRAAPPAGRPLGNSASRVLLGPPGAPSI